MNELEKKILIQYEKRYFSVQQIADNLKMAPSKVRHALNKLGVKKRSISEAIRKLNVTKFKKGIFCVKKDLNNYEEKLKIAGIMLYWGEGTKNGGTVAFSNSNPEMVSLFLKFLRNVCNISEERVRALLHIYEDQDRLELERYWSKKIKIPLRQFSRSFLHKTKSGSYKKKSDFGTIAIRYSDKELLKLINFWIKEYAKKL